MEYIIQGSNDPLLLEIEGIKDNVKISAVLSSYGNVKKAWNDDDIMIQDNILILPLTEEETLKLARGVVKLDIKALDADGKVIFMDIVSYRVMERDNKTVLTGGMEA